MCWKAGVLNDTGVDCEMCYQVAFWEANDFGGRAWEREGGGGCGGVALVCCEAAPPVAN